MIIRENINFERGQDPKKSLRIGVHHLIPQIIEKFEESPFELTRRGEVLDLEQKYEVSPENFHNPAGYPKYDWEFADIMEDFEVSILYMIDLNNGEILRKMKVSNSRIDAEYIDNENWKITSLNPNKIYEEIDQDYALIDIADAAEYLWDAYQKQTEEEEFEDEGLDESLDFVRGIVDKKYNVFDGPASKVHERLNFERGMDPKKSMGIGFKAKISRGLSRLVQELHIGSINLSGNGTDLWLEVSDYGIANFEDYFFSLLNKEFFKQYYIEAKPRKYKNSWKNDWVFIIKPEYKSSFRACFDRNGYLLAVDELEESVNFERGLDKEKLRIGNIRPVEKLKNDYNEIVKFVQTSKGIKFQYPFSKESMEYVSDKNHFGWGNIHDNFKNMSREELFPFELIVRKYKKLMGLDES